MRQHNPYNSQASFAKGIDPINSHTSYLGKSTGSNKRSVPNNRTVSSKWNQRVHISVKYLLQTQSQLGLQIRSFKHWI